MFPLDLGGLSHSFVYALLFASIGFGFGAVLEMTGFGNTRKLAGQFYFTDLTVFKTMFTGIVVAGVLVGLATSLGWLDMSRVWINPTFLWPGIVGGLVMGVGFVVGGFCPGTSLVAAATGKLDGMVFVAGALVGVWLFGESVDSMEAFFVSGSLGRFTLADWLDLPVGVVLAAISGFAVLLFVGAEAIEKARGNPALQGLSAKNHRFRVVGAWALALGVGVVLVAGQPDVDTRFRRLPGAQQLVDERAMFVSPAEVVSLRKDLNLKVEVLDLRDESAFNLFHVAHAERVTSRQLDDRGRLRTMQEAGPSVVYFLVGQDDSQALAAYRRLRTAGIVNLYVIDGGMERWLDLYPPPACVAQRTKGPGSPWRFRYASGASLPSASPELSLSRSFQVECRKGETQEPAAPSSSVEGALHRGSTWPDHPFDKKVKLQTKALVKGGCG